MIRSVQFICVSAEFRLQTSLISRGASSPGKAMAEFALEGNRLLQPLHWNTPMLLWPFQCDGVILSLWSGAGHWTNNSRYCSKRFQSCKMTLDDVVQKANETSQESLTPKNYSMFVAGKPVDSDRKWLDVTNKYTNDVGG